MSGTDPLLAKIRALPDDDDDDDETSVNIVAQPGATVNVRASRPDSAAPLSAQSREWKKTAVRIVGALMGPATLIKALWEATR